MAPPCSKAQGPRSAGKTASKPWSRATTDAQGRYHFRVGPGRYRVLAFGVSNQSTELVVENPDEATVVRDFHLAEPERPRMFEGRVVEKAAGGDRPLADAMVEAVGLGNGQGFSARADAEGRFRGPRRDDGPLVIYARSLDGKLAGFTLIRGGLDEGLATVTPASKVSGRVVYGSGQPRGGYRVQVKLESGPDFVSSGRVFRHVRTDDRGRYSLDGAVVGSFGEAWVTADDFPRSSRSTSSGSRSREKTRSRCPTSRFHPTPSSSPGRLPPPSPRPDPSAHADRDLKGRDRGPDPGHRPRPGDSGAG